MVRWFDGKMMAFFSTTFGNMTLGPSVFSDVAGKVKPLKMVHQPPEALG